MAEQLSDHIPIIDTLHRDESNSPVRNAEDISTPRSLTSRSPVKTGSMSKMATVVPLKDSSSIEMTEIGSKAAKIDARAPELPQKVAPNERGIAPAEIISKGRGGSSGVVYVESPSVIADNVSSARPSGIQNQLGHRMTKSSRQHDREVMVGTPVKEGHANYMLM